MFDLIAAPLGWIMRLIYHVVDSYGMSIVLFTLLIKLATLPTSYKTQVNSARIGLLSAQMEKLKKSYANNPTRLQEEQQKLYQKEGINPSSGCLANLLTMIVLMGVYQVVIQPLTYILQLKDQIPQAKEILTAYFETNGITEKYFATRPELIILQYCKQEPSIFSEMEGFVDKILNFNNVFLGFDLSAQPSLNPAGGWTATALLLAAIPIASGLIQLLMTFITQRHNKKINPDMQSMTSMNIMLYTMPFISIWIGFSLPAGVGFYWIMNSLMSLLIQLGLYAYLTPQRMARINEKEKQKQLAKGPTWTQRMMAAAQEQEQAQRQAGNRSRYSDGDDGMSRKERAEFEKKLIEDARRRSAEKYGDDLDLSDADDAAADH